jgi:hypothetical protein
VKKIERFNKEKISEGKFSNIRQGWSAYSGWSNNYNLKKSLQDHILLQSSIWQKVFIANE